MADNVAITAGSGTPISTDQLGTGEHVQHVKLMDGAADSSARIGGDAANGLDIDVTRDAPDATASGTITAVEQSVTISPGRGEGAIACQITGTWVGTIVFEATVDGSTWVAVTAYNPTTQAFSGSAGSNGVSIYPMAAFQSFRARASAWTSGTASLSMRGCRGDAGGTQFGPLPTGSNVIGHVRSRGEIAHDASEAGDPVLAAGFASVAPPADVSADGDRCRVWVTRSGAQAISGDQQHNGVEVGNPIKIGGPGTDAAPSAVVDGRRVAAWFKRNGAQVAEISAAGVLIGGDAANGLDVDVTRALVQGEVAHDAADSGNPQKIGGKARRTLPSAVSADNDRADVITDRFGRVYVVVTDTPEALLGAYFFHTGAHLVLASADGSTSGRWFLQNPVGSSVTCRVKRVTFRSQLGSALVAVTSPRITIERYTFTGTASGASITAAKRRTADAANTVVMRTANTGMTLSAVAIVTAFLPVASATAVGYNTPGEAAWEPLGGDVLELAPGEALVCRQPDAGTSSDTRRFVTTVYTEEYTT